MKRTTLCEQVIHLAEQGYSVATITNVVGAPWAQVRNCVSYWRKCLKAKGKPVPPCICGLPSNHQSLCCEKPLGDMPWQPPPADIATQAVSLSNEKLKKRYRVTGKTLRRWLTEIGISRRYESHDPESRARIEALAADGWSVRTIATKTGKTQRSIRHFVRRWRERLQSEGASLPPCRCGSPHDHSHFCAEKIRGEGVGRRVRRQVPEDFEQVAPTLSLKALERHYRTGCVVISRWLSQFPELARVPRSTAARPLRPVYRANSGISDSTYNMIERCVPTNYAPDIRADIISTIYLAVLDGSLPEERLLLDGRSVLYQVLRSHGIMYQTTASIDLELDDEGQRYIDMLADENALDAFERIFEDDEA